jgi:N-acyl-D-aspartate/D-glutamate deacylase
MIRPGVWADLMLFDPSTVARGGKTRVNDLPAGGARLMTPPVGLHGVWVNGQRVIERNGQPVSMPSTDRWPGQLLRSR